MEGKSQNLLSDKNVKRLSEAFCVYQDENRFSKVVSLEEIKNNDFNLNIASYVQIADEEEKIDVKLELKKLKKLQLKRKVAEEKMTEFLEELKV